MGRQSKYDAAFKAKVAMEAMKEKETLAELSKRFNLSPSKITQFIKNAFQAFERPADNKRELKKVKAENERLLRKVGQMRIDCDFFCESLRGCWTESEIIELEKQRPAGMSRKSFCEYMSFNRSTLYYKPKGENIENLKIMELMDKYYIEHPTAGVLQMTAMLSLQDYRVNHKRVRRLLRKMGIFAIYPQRSLSYGGCPKYIHPYLLRDIEITYPNQVWSTDISYIPMKEGFMYLYAIIDVYSRFIVGWKLSNTLSATNCYNLVQDCIKLYRAPKIINSDQGSQYTTKAWEELLNTNNILISMDGKGRCKDRSNGQIS